MCRQDLDCAICGPETGYAVRFGERLSGAHIADFSARKAPAHVHFQIVECKGCGLVYSNVIYPEDEILRLYKESRFIEEAQLGHMMDDYVRELSRVKAANPEMSSLLEIGCANGMFLERVGACGFDEIRGVEPGVDAYQKSKTHIRPLILNDFFTDQHFEPESFDIVCIFQAMDHFIDPNLILKDVLRVLRPGGMFLAINHNITSWMPRVFGRRCPMYDIEHIYLFSPRTMTRILEKNGFESARVRNLWNSYNVSYALKMFPMPDAAKRAIDRVFAALSLGNLTVRAPAGNMVSTARKPL